MAGSGQIAGYGGPVLRTACELIVGKRGALLNSYPRALAGYLCRLVCWSYSLCSLAAGLVVVHCRLQLGSSSQEQQPCAVGYLPCRNDDTTPSCCHMSVGIVGVCCRLSHGQSPRPTTTTHTHTCTQKQRHQARRRCPGHVAIVTHRSIGIVGGFCRWIGELPEAPGIITRVRATDFFFPNLTCPRLPRPRCRTQTFAP